MKKLKRFHVILIVIAVLFLAGFRGVALYLPVNVTYEDDVVLPIGFVMDNDLYNYYSTRNSKVAINNISILRGVHRGEEKEFLFDLNSGEVIEEYHPSEDEISVEILSNGGWISLNAAESRDLDVFDGKLKIVDYYGNCIYENIVADLPQEHILTVFNLSSNNRYLTIWIGNSFDAPPELSFKFKLFFDLEERKEVELPEEIMPRSYTFTSNSNFLDFYNPDDSESYVYNLKTGEAIKLPLKESTDSYEYSLNTNDVYLIDTHSGVSKYNLDSGRISYVFSKGKLCIDDSIAFNDGILVLAYNNNEMYPIFRHYFVKRIGRLGYRTHYIGGLPDNAVWNEEGTSAYYIDNDGKLTRMVLW